MNPLFRLIQRLCAGPCNVGGNVAHALERLQKCEAAHSKIFCDQVELRLSRITQELEDLADGKLCFSSTETWRTVYREVLERTTTKSYLSVALIRSDDYWRDAPGQSSLDFNYELISHGFHIHRLFIIDEFFWPKLAKTPSKQLFHWILEQYQRGIETSLVRLTDLEDEPTLICDFGIYGDTAVGYQETDFQGKTVRYELCFDRSDLVEAEHRWEQLLVYAKPFSTLLESE